MGNRASDRGNYRLIRKVRTIKETNIRKNKPYTFHNKVNVTFPAIQRSATFSALKNTTLTPFWKSWAKKLQPTHSAQQCICVWATDSAKKSWKSWMNSQIWKDSVPSTNVWKQVESVHLAMYKFFVAATVVWLATSLKVVYFKFAKRHSPIYFPPNPNPYLHPGRQSHIPVFCQYLSSIYLNVLFIIFKAIHFCISTRNK